MLKKTVFCYNKKQVWQLAGDSEEADHEERVPASDYPVQVWLLATDYSDGHGWGHDVLDKLGVAVKEVFGHDVGHEDETYAVLASAKNEATLYRLLSSSEFEFSPERPEELHPISRSFTATNWSRRTNVKPELQPGPKFVHAELETNEENHDGISVTLYFSEQPTAEEVKHEFDRLYGKLPLSVDTQFYQYGEYPNALSKRSKLVRIQGFPTG